MWKFHERFHISLDLSHNVAEERLLVVVTLRYRLVFDERVDLPVHYVLSIPNRSP